MKMTNEFIFCKNLFSTLGRKESYDLIDSSNLSAREREVLYTRFVKGLSLKECADLLVIEENSVSKALHRSIKKLYKWIENRENATQILSLLNIKPSKYPEVNTSSIKSQ
ncbi:MAG: hypothetical protein MJZ37_00550 [Bacilli bacterium]|nr:hypothetical protein [Bacilli bacterium]